MAAPSVSLTLSVVSATSLRPMQKGITSNPMCEISLLVDDGVGRRVNQQEWSTSSNARADQKLMSQNGHMSSSVDGVRSKTFRSKVVRSTLNPIWNLDVDFGDYNMESVLGVLVVVKHVEKMGMIKKDIGQVLLPTRELLELRTQSSREKTYTLEPTDEVYAREAQEGLNNRKFGSVTIRFNSYKWSGSSASITSTPSVTDLRPTNLSDGSVTHEDDFSGETKHAAKHNVQAEVRKVQSFHQTKPIPGETWYAVNADWVTRWLLFVSKHRGNPEHNPGEINNMPLLNDDLPNGRFEVRDDLQIKKDFRMINKRSWEFYQTQYGGGPAIEVPVPRDCVDTSSWITSLKLHEVARVGSSYFDSDGEE
ncbi:hypothetical protein Poli38472_009420 [Pythium oligandrum]|uniref:DUSP domain-containing protein n=1 Tax=Pythium oligandrum TaxID=41045 RepID=A0A8K1CLQ1_PYTOL|nr:hypothetical protein Poli38472_009420 [Pythium oligandrum]|eukprot:TMW65253.1 hypothetical protein Poli38472_009420 [Pythium oligandrum]